jgi:nitrite reductase/ring-hydroxylating ferredoxin subunit/uncharacterized membrane protein
MDLGLRRIVDAIGSRTSLDGTAKPLSTAAMKAIRPGPVKDMLSGTWLGHPLHPVLTDVTIGAFLSSSMLDVLGDERHEAAADRLIGLGLLSVVPTAAAGIADWADTVGSTRRIGFVHGLGNVAVAGLFGLSWLARKTGARGLGKVLSMAGMGLATGTAYLGGHLSFAKGVGVDQTAFQRRPHDWTDAIDGSDLEPGKPARARVGEVRVLVYRDGERLLAIDDTCNHRGCNLTGGAVEADPDGRPTIRCTCHGSTFRLDDGSLVRGPATAPQPAYDARIEGGKVQVKLRR